MDSSKVKKLLVDHPEMKNLLHRVPEILNNPIIIMESRTVAGAYVLYGDVFNKKDPVMVSILINPVTKKGIQLKVHKVSNAYAKDHAQYQLDHSVVKYVSPDKKRTAAWNRRTRLQLPFMPTNSSSTNNVPQNQQNSKTQSGKTRNSLAVTEDSTGKELTKGQQEFFKDSKIRDEEGRLLRLYHGSMANFTVFDIGEARDSEDIEAFFFSPNAEEAEGYGNTREFYLNITNPADFDTAYDIFFKHRKENPSGAGARAREELISLGYDGVAAIDSSDPEYPEYLAFYPEQIKLV